MIPAFAGVPEDGLDGRGAVAARAGEAFAELLSGDAFGIGEAIEVDVGLGEVAAEVFGKVELGEAELATKIGKSAAERCFIAKPRTF